MILANNGSSRIWQGRVTAGDLKQAYSRTQKLLESDMRLGKIPKNYALTPTYNISGRGLTRQTKTSISLAKKYSK